MCAKSPDVVLNVEDFKDVFFTSLWYWGRVSLPPSPTKQLTKPHSSTILPLGILFVSAEGDTKPTSHVLPCKNELWNALTRLELFSDYLVPKRWTGGLNFMGYSENSSCFQHWSQNWKQQPEFLCWNKVINKFLSSHLLFPVLWRVVGVGSPPQLNDTGKTLARGEFPLNLPPNTLLLFLLQGQGIIFKSESPNFNHRPHEASAS